MKAVNNERYFETARVNMVKNQLMTLDINNQNLLDSFLQIPRELFYKEDVNQQLAYLDSTVAEDANLMLSPEILFRLLYKLDLQNSDKLLIASAGFGYAAHVAAPLVSSVLAVETNATANAHFMQNAGRIKAKNLALKSVNINEKFMEEAPFHKILINEILSAPVSDLLLSQLNDGGKLIAMILNSKGEIEYKLFSKTGYNEIFSELLFVGNY